jgi:hypothetical protein
MLEDNTRHQEASEEEQFRKINRTPFSLGTSHEKQPQDLSERDNPSEPLNDY